MNVGIMTVYRDRRTGGKPEEAPHRPEIGYEYLYKTLASLAEMTKATNRFKFHIFTSTSDMPVNLPDLKIHLHLPAEPVRLYRNGNRMVRWLAAHGGQFITLQDDLVFCRHALDRMATIKMPSQAGVCSFYTPTESNRQPMRLTRYRPSEMYGTLALRWRADAANDYLNSQQATSHTGYKGWDMVIKRWLANSRKWHACRHHPCLVQHIGSVSAAHHKGRRQTPNFPGAKFDAMKGGV